MAMNSWSGCSRITAEITRYNTRQVLIMTNNPGEDRLRVAPKAGVHAGFISPRNAVTSTRKQQVDSHLVGLVDPDSYEAEQYRKLRYTLEELHKPGESLVVGICSPVAADGKSLTALNLAGTLAQDPSVRVLLVDADLRRKSDSLKDRLPLKYIEGPGLIDMILDPALSLRDVVRSIPLFNLSVVTTGIRTAAPYESLRSPRFGQFIAEARKYYDYVILDAPPVVPVSDCRIMARWVDGFLMVVAAHRTPRT